MSLNYANGVEFWNVKDNTPQNGSKLTDAQGNELTFGGGGGGGVTFVEMEQSGSNTILQMTAGELAAAVNSGVVFAKDVQTVAEEDLTGIQTRCTLITFCAVVSDGSYMFIDANDTRYGAESSTDNPVSLS